ncbi:MAG: Unknown protein [uncultured Sulfurovum sp.]|uniref:Uncharacterized protein n=1 Tax=uncultured Sulfurovum sp. TaxID=269237 RepID=A0A6S6U5R1_9BACT|nr:MAG: Unknown protein [uncultured Sulfurovum sp.]
MTTVLMILMLPMGLYVYFWVEKKDQIAYQKVFDDYQQKIVNNQNLTDAQKIVKFEQMLEQNGYEVTEVTLKRVVAKRKILSMGLIMIGLGLYIVGLFVYLFYFYVLQKPHTVVFELN